MRESAGRFWRCRVCAPALPPIPALSGPFRGVSGSRGAAGAGIGRGTRGGRRGEMRGIARTGWGGAALGRGFRSGGSCPAGDGERAVLSPRCSKIGAGVCADPTQWGGGPVGAGPPPPSLRSGTGARGGAADPAGRGGGASACHRRAGRRGLRPGRDGRGGAVRGAGIRPGLAGGADASRPPRRGVGRIAVRDRGADGWAASRPAGGQGASWSRRWQAVEADRARRWFQS